MAERTEILFCSCKHEFQDSIYGSHMRVHNVNTKGEAFCTVCSPSYRRDKNQNAISPSPVFGNVFIPARKGRNSKKVPI